MSEREVQRLLTFLNEAIVAAERLVRRFPVGRVTDVEIATMCMHLRTVALAGSVGALVRANSLPVCPSSTAGWLRRSWTYRTS